MTNIMTVSFVLNIKYWVTKLQTETGTENIKAILKYVKIVPQDIYAQSPRIV